MLLIIFKVLNAADFTITLEDEGRVITNLTNELQTLTVELKQSLAEVEDNVQREGSEIRRGIKHREEEMRKVCHYTEEGRCITLTAM